VDLYWSKVQMLRAEAQKLEQMLGSVLSNNRMHSTSVVWESVEKLAQSFIFAEHSPNKKENWAVPFPVATFWRFLDIPSNWALIVLAHVCSCKREMAW
jgi:hypothetical protein